MAVAERRCRPAASWICRGRAAGRPVLSRSDRQIPATLSGFRREDRLPLRPRHDGARHPGASARTAWHRGVAGPGQHGDGCHAGAGLAITSLPARKGRSARRLTTPNRATMLSPGEFGLSSFRTCIWIGVAEYLHAGRQGSSSVGHVACGREIGRFRTGDGPPGQRTTRASRRELADIRQKLGYPKPAISEHCPTDDLRTTTLAELDDKMGSSPDGLSQAGAERRIAHYGAE
jgi:hypothetical protein